MFWWYNTTHGTVQLLWLASKENTVLPYRGRCSFVCGCCCCCDFPKHILFLKEEGPAESDQTQQKTGHTVQTAGAPRVTVAATQTPSGGRVLSPAAQKNPKSISRSSFRQPRNCPQPPVVPPRIPHISSPAAPPLAAPHREQTATVGRGHHDGVTRWTPSRVIGLVKIMK